MITFVFLEAEAVEAKILCSTFKVSETSLGVCVRKTLLKETKGKIRHPLVKIHNTHITHNTQTSLGRNNHVFNKLLSESVELNGLRWITGKQYV